MKEFKKIPCCLCRSYLTNDEIAFILRLFGMATGSFYCLSCLAKKLDESEDRLKEKITALKISGCCYFNER